MKAKLITVLFFICLINIQPMLQSMGASGGAGGDGALTPDIRKIGKFIKARTALSGHLLRFLDTNTLNSLRLVNKDLCQAVDAIYQTLHVKRVNKVRARKMPHITSLRVSDLELIPEMLAELIKNCPNLKALNLNHCPRSGEGLVEALTDLSARGCLQLLEELYLYYTWTTVDQVLTIVSLCPHLKILNLDFCPGSADGLATALEFLSEGWRPPLEELNLSYTRTTTDQVRIIVSHCSHLKILNLNYCPGSADGLIEALRALREEERPRLEKLFLYYTDTTAGQVYAIVSRCPNLKILDLSNCTGSADGLVEALRDLPEEHRPPLEKLFLYRTDVTEEHIDALRELLQNCEISY